ncbi:MAG: TIM barrel protein [Bacteroidales bacterium]|nr:TIM barrel protein [Bacteroidales bacterium]
MKRRAFVKNSIMGATSLVSTPLLANITSSKPLNISLAQWSLHRSINEGIINPVDFASIAKERYKIDAVEYVNQFYLESATDEIFWHKMKERSNQAGIKNLVIMVDDEGDLGTADKKKRMQAVENHYKWVHAAKIMGCHSVRVNAFGDPDRDIYRAAIMDGMSRLAGYAAKSNLSIIIENHGLFSSDAALIAGIIKEVNMPNFGAFPDFGNWCLSAKWGTTQGECDKVYDPYRGVSELLPYAKAVSAKSYNFNEKGEDTKIDYYKMMKIVKKSDYDGYIGIEYEGIEKGEHEGILITKNLMEKAWNTI